MEPVSVPSPLPKHIWNNTLNQLLKILLCSRYPVFSIFRAAANRQLYFQKQFFHLLFIKSPKNLSKYELCTILSFFDSKTLGFYLL